MSTYKQEIATYYDAQPLPSSQARRKGKMQHTERLATHLPAIETGGVHLDVGTGPAWLPLVLARKYPHLRSHGVDLSLESLRLGKKNVLREGRGEAIKLYHRDVEELEIFPEACDLITCRGAFQQLLDPRRFLVNSRILLRPKGVLALALKESSLDIYKDQAVREALGLTFGEESKPTHAQKELRRLVRRAGFDSIRIIAEEIEIPFYVSERIWSGITAPLYSPLRDISASTRLVLQDRFRDLLSSGYPSGVGAEKWSCLYAYARV